MGTLTAADSDEMDNTMNTFVDTHSFNAAGDWRKMPDLGVDSDELSASSGGVPPVTRSTPSGLSVTPPLSR